MIHSFDDAFDDSQDSSDEEKKAKSSEFARLLEDSFKKPQKKLVVGDKVRGEILVVGKEEVYVATGAAGTSSEGIVPKKDLLNSEGQFAGKVGDFLDLYVTQVRKTETYLSPKPTSKNVSDDLEDAFDMMLPIEGRVTEVCKGGVRVSLSGKVAFCPISQLDLVRVEKADDYVGQRFEFLITQFSEGGRNIIVSRRKLLEENRGLSEGEFVDAHQIGDVIPGKVKRIEDFGAFVEVRPGIEGLLHISELSWSRVAHPSEIVKVGDEIRVKVLKTEATEGRMKISLSLKQAGVEPWQSLPESIKAGQVVPGRVTRCMKFGAFVELTPGIEGLIPLSEMSDTKRVVRSNELIKEGEKVSVLIKEVNVSAKRISLSLKASSLESAQTDQDEWRGYSGQSSGTFGTLADKLKGALDKKDKKKK